LRELSFDEQKDLLIKGWMSHDARWFRAVAERFGIEEANRMNQAVARELGRVEMRRWMKVSGASPPRNIEEHLRMSEAAISLFGPDLLEYEIRRLDPQSYEVHITRCFAHENVMKAGIQDLYECGILSRIEGWIDAHGLNHRLTPPPEKCMKVSGKECCYKITLQSP
jgi:hypothetical protein